MKIFNKNLKIEKVMGGTNSKLVTLRKKIGDVGQTKYLPSFTKEWKNTIYSFNKNILKNIPVNNLNINKIIQSYFNLYFKNNNFLGGSSVAKYLKLKKRRNLLKRIFVSDAEIKYTNNKAVITLYVVNREKKFLINKYLSMNKIISNYLINRGYLLFIENISKLYAKFTKIQALGRNAHEYFFVRDIVRKKKYIHYKLAYFNTFMKLKHLYFKKIWSILLTKYSLTSLKLVRKFHLAYSLNQYKFNKLRLLPKLSTILTKIIGKKVEYNIINLKSIAYHTDLFTNVLALKLKNIKNSYMKNIFSILNRAHIPRTNSIIERTLNKSTAPGNILSSTQVKDLKILSHLSDRDVNSNNLDKLLNELTSRKEATSGNAPQTIHNLVYNSIDYKNMGGIRIEVKGRLTKRYRADRSIYFVKWKGGLKNIDSSFQGLSSVLFRGNTKSNTSYSLSTGKRRIGAFAVKGWIGGK